MIRKVALLVLFSFLAAKYVHGQIVKTKIGYSTWMYKGEIVADSVLTFVMTYDSLGRLQMEHRIMRDTFGKPIDSIYSKIDTNGLYYFYKDKYSTQFTRYDSLGNPTYFKIDFYEASGSAKNTLRTRISNFENAYNSKGKIVKSVQTIKGDFPDSKTIIYTYFGKWQIKKEEYLKLYTKKNKRGKPLIRYNRFSAPNNTKSTWCYRQRYTNFGETKFFKDIREKETFKTTHHFYKNKKEVRREERFYQTGLRVTTYFEYMYY